MKAEDREIPVNHSFDTEADHSICLENGKEESNLLLLQGKPIGEKVVQYGPFVMNAQEEIERAISDYRSTQFGGWPWDTREPVHSSDALRFARYTDGRVEEKR